MSNDCMITVVDGKYVCDENQFRALCPKRFVAANLPAPVPVMLSVGGHVDGPYTPTDYVIDNGVNYLPAGMYEFGFDCADFDGVEAPAEGAVELCCEDATEMEMFCAKIVAAVAGGGEVTITGGTVTIDGEVVVTGMTDLIDKLCGEGGISIADLIAQLIAINTKWCEAEGANFILLLKCLEQIKANTSAITGIETSMGQVGCTRGPDGELNGSVLVCKVSPEDGGEPEIVVWWFGYDGTVVKDYAGEYEGCTSLKALEDLLDAICKKLDAQIQWTICEGYYVSAAGNPVKTNWKIGCDKDGNTVYPNGAECPVFLESPSGDDPALPECSCTFRSSSKRLIGIATTSITTTGGGTGTHNITFDPTMGTGGIIEATLDNDIGGTAGANQICTLSGAAGASFSYFPSSLVKNGPGDYTSTIIAPTNNCEAELQAREWNLHTDGTTESAGFGVRHCTSIATDCADPEGVGCGVPINPQPDPATVVKGPVPDEDELLCLQKLKEQEAAQHEEVVDVLSDLLDKQCLMYDATANPNACGSPVPENGLDKEALTLTLDGDVGAQYPIGTTISLKDANGNICGSATSSGETELVDGKTVITIEECELVEGKEPVVIKTAAPVLQASVKAVKNVIKKAVAVRSIKVEGGK